MEPKILENKLVNKVDQELKQGTKISIIKLLNHLIENANEARASDIHIDPQRDNVRIRYRVDGMLHDAHLAPKEIHSEIISRVKILAGLRTDEHQSAQDGRFRFALNEAENPIDIRVSIAPTYYGENAVLRLLTDKAQEFTLEALGFRKENAEKIRAAIQKPYGMILATGPTGSGKTTTLYTILKTLNTPEVSIITIEDPIEYAITGIEQIQVNPGTGLTFANGLRSILRQDPNIIMVGEIRDPETAGISVNTALTGHLLLSTLHTNDAATCLPRLLDLRIEPYLVASTVNVVMGQRLVRKVCAHCKMAKRLDTAEFKSLEKIFAKSGLGTHHTFYHGRGCEKCNNSGYSGRIGIHEVMVVDEDIRNAILRKVSASELKKIAIQRGMIPILEDGFRKAKEGITTIEEVLRIMHE